jgi:capsular polysaccharide biosynthesis protein
MTFSDYLRILLRFAGLVITCTVVGALVGFVFASLPATKYRARFAVTLAPNTDDPGTYGNLIDSLDRRSVPSTFAEVVESPAVTGAAAAIARVDPDDFDVESATVRESNVIGATVTGESGDRAQTYAAALLDASTLTFTKLYPLYSVTPLRSATTSEAVPRQVLSTTLIGALAGAIFAYLLALVIDANRDRKSRARINPAPFARARIGTDLTTPRRARRRRTHRPARR